MATPIQSPYRTREAKAKSGGPYRCAVEKLLTVVMARGGRVSVFEATPVGGDLDETEALLSHLVQIGLGRWFITSGCGRIEFRLNPDAIDVGEVPSPERPR